MLFDTRNRQVCPRNLETHREPEALEHFRWLLDQEELTLQAIQNATEATTCYGD